ncbi:hypothetical protein A8C32_17300 [Flavivirga aquatica]|uniref:Outer membrane protein beta-barrel domain-containing protein n=1 Tax=Flavivirga aquatica TaxID=1849968 RepID=A0A1E5T849_9FLAO|nr:hypothetical protein A8C32_17300 [Flavivirga aquatica]
MGLFKLYGAFDTTNFELIQGDINDVEGVRFKLDNNNVYLNGSYRGILNDTWSMHGGFSYTHAKNNMDIIDRTIKDTENSLHTKLKFKNRINNRFKLYFGAECFATNFKEKYNDASSQGSTYVYDNNIAAAFAEADIFISKNLAFKTRVRSEYS